MPEQPIPEPVPLSSGPFDPGRAQPMPQSRPSCRALTVDGHRCKNKVLGGLHLCFSHYRNRRPALPEPRSVSVPLLEDRSAIQLLATQILHGLLSHRLDPLRARVALSALRIAALTVPGLVVPARPRQNAAPDAPEDAVCRLGRDHEDFISADGDLSQPSLNPSCSVAESVHAVCELLDSLAPASRCHPEFEPADLPTPDPGHDWERCACFSCSDLRERTRQRADQLRAATAG